MSVVTVRTKDADGRTPITRDEYYAMQQLYGMAGVFGNAAPMLEERLKATIPNGWRDMQLIRKTSKRLLEKMLYTIPIKRLRLIDVELQNTVCTVQIRAPRTGHANHAYVPEEELTRLIKRLRDDECTFCDKHGGEAGKCPLRKDFNALYPWDIPDIPGACPWAQMDIPTVGVPGEGEKFV